jgi:ATP-binding cassette, subfamily B, bacterial
VQEALNKLMKGRTPFAIAHRLSTVVDADRILVLKGGQLIEQGSHSQLMRLDGSAARDARNGIARATLYSLTGPAQGVSGVSFPGHLALCRGLRVAYAEILIQ